MDDFRRYNDPTVALDRKPRSQLDFIVIPGDSLRVVRGGSYSNSPTAARNSARLMARADQRAASSGFRICRTTTTVSPKPIKTDTAGN
jgi:formylglycine-generating enzyme required for sulfatase activity